MKERAERKGGWQINACWYSTCPVFPCVPHGVFRDASPSLSICLASLLQWRVQASSLILTTTDVINFASLTLFFTIRHWIYSHFITVLLTDDIFSCHWWCRKWQIYVEKTAITTPHELRLDLLHLDIRFEERLLYYFVLFLCFTWFIFVILFVSQWWSCKRENAVVAFIAFCFTPVQPCHSQPWQHHNLQATPMWPRHTPLSLSRRACSSQNLFWGVIITPCVACAGVAWEGQPLVQQKRQRCMLLTARLPTLTVPTCVSLFPGRETLKYRKTSINCVIPCQWRARDKSVQKVSLCGAGWANPKSSGEAVGRVPPSAGHLLMNPSWPLMSTPAGTL